MKYAQCIVFDVDDTLYLERDYVRSGLKALDRWLRREHGLRGFYTTANTLFEEGLRRVIFDEALGQLDLRPTPQLIDEMVRIYRLHEPQIELLPDARRCLQGLQNSFQLAALTGGPPESQHAKVEALGLTHWCLPIIYAGLKGARLDKPHPRPFLELERRSGFSGSDCIYVSDNPTKDFVAPLSLGWAVARIRRPQSLHFELPTPEGIPEFADLDEFARWYVGGQATGSWRGRAEQA